MKEVGRLWNLLNPLEKKKYEVEASKGKISSLNAFPSDKERYKRELKEYNKGEGLRVNSPLLPMKPKKCLSTYMIFVKEVKIKFNRFQTRP